ncbi:MAG: pilus assembly protein [Acidobacteria bacterium]|nr:pilus assembly protein [Acidobacteriota bacterium]
MIAKQAKEQERGANLIEFAVGAILFLTVLFGAIDWSWVFFQHQTILWRASDAARWASANKVDSTQVTNMVLCGSPTCTGSYSGFFQNAAVTVEHVQSSDVIDTITTVTRYYARVTVKNYKIQQLSPFLGQSFTGKPIIVAQPMECQDAAGDCTKWN